MTNYHVSSEYSALCFPFLTFFDDNNLQERLTLTDKNILPLVFLSNMKIIFRSGSPSPRRMNDFRASYAA